MKGARRMFRSAATFALAMIGVVASTARAQEPAPPDSALHSYVKQLSDSTDAWFGITAAPVDTAGLDSALAAGLALPPGAHRADRDSRKLRLGWSPAPGFNRVDGAQLGADLWLRGPIPGRLGGRVQYTTGSEDVLGEGGWSDSWRIEPMSSRLSFHVAAGRWTEPRNRDHFDPFFATVKALLSGSDRHHYLRRDGWYASLGLGGENHWVRVGWRDNAETSLPFTTRWTLFGDVPDPRENDPVVEGRARELALSAETTIPGTRFHVRAMHWTSDPRMGSDFTYRRTSLLAAGDVSIGQHLALVPRVAYGRLRGDVLPQDAFYFGGTPDIRTVEPYSVAGAGRVFVRSDLVLVDDLGTLLHLPLPAWMPLQAGVFAASGAVFGSDPLTGDAIPTRRDWPRQSEWLSETGVSLSWRFGFPDPLSALRFEWATPIGADTRSSAFRISYSHPLGELHRD